MKKISTVIKYENTRGFGYLEEPDGKTWFFHISACVGFVPTVGDAVSFVPGVGRKGPAAFEIEQRVVVDPVEILKGLGSRGAE